jgi:hypothetical protein
MIGKVSLSFNELGVGEAPKEANHLTITLVTSPTPHVSLPFPMAHNILSQVSLAKREIRMHHIGMLKLSFNGINPLHTHSMPIIVGMDTNKVFSFIFFFKFLR